MRVGRVSCVVAIVATVVGACGSAPAPSSSTPSAPSDVTAATPYRFPPIRAELPTSTPSPAPGPWPPTSEWRIHASDFFRYEISYPPTWRVDEGNAQFADEIDARDLPWLFVRRGVAESTGRTIAAAVGDDIVIERRDDRAELVSAHPIALPGGYEGMYLLYHGRIRVGPVTVQRIIVANGPVFYYFSLYGPPHTETADIALFKQIYESWKAT